ncbi:MAG TPA: hypothetical protein VGM76_10705 [Lacipirellulaceae bacterium]|jgi:hypothetical protein
MSTANWTDSDTERAKQIWVEYNSTHDLGARKGEVAGVDPSSGQIWLGSTVVDIVNQMKIAGVFVPLFFFRIGYDTYLRKGGRRLSLAR